VGHTFPPTRGGGRGGGGVRVSRAPPSYLPRRHGPGIDSAIDFTKIYVDARTWNQARKVTGLELWVDFKVVGGRRV
jgi:hypothetical protein